MPQPKSTSAGGRTTASGRRPSPASPRRRRTAEPQDARADQVLRFLDPRELVVITRDRLQDVLDDAVMRGRLTRADASLLVSELVHRGRRQTEDLLADLEQLLGRQRESLPQTDGKAQREPSPAFPIEGYDDLTAAQVTSHLGELAPAELRKMGDYERRNANRKSVLAAIEQRLA